MIRNGGKLTHGEHEATSIGEGGGFFQIIPAGRFHVRKHQDLVGSVGILNNELAILDVGPGNGLVIDEVKVDPGCHESVAQVEGGLGRLLAIGLCLVRRDRVDHGNIGNRIALTHQVGEAVEVLQESSHVRPVRHAKMVAGRCPFPVGAVSGIIEPV